MWAVLDIVPEPQARESLFMVGFDGEMCCRWLLTVFLNGRRDPKMR